MKKVSVNVQLLGISMILIELIFPMGIFLLFGLLLNIIGLLMAISN